MKGDATKRVRPDRRMTIFVKPLLAQRGLHSKLDGYGLSKRQLEVAWWVIHGLSNRQIAERLFITEQTVKDHLHDVFEVMNIRRRSELAAKVLGF
jgi:DNA-binding CsgD family transcriptional regulator